MPAQQQPAIETTTKYARKELWVRAHDIDNPKNATFRLATERDLEDFGLHFVEYEEE